MSSAEKRLRTELARMMQDSPPICSVSLVNDNIFDWEAKIQGPEDTPYAGGTFRISMKFPKEYPWKPPSVTFLTRIHHCNVFKNGDICMSILTEEGWMPWQSVATVILSIICLLNEPMPYSSYTHKMLENREEYDSKAAAWTKIYASEK